MNHGFSSSPLPPTFPRRSRRAAAGLSLATAVSVIFAASTAVAQQPPAIGYTAGSWPPPTRFGGDVEAPSRDAVAQAPSEESGASFDLGGATLVPLMLGVQATLELPYRFLVQGELGVMPAAYVNGIDSVLTRSGVYDATTSALVRSTMQNSLVVRASAGFRPFSAHGLEIMGGYTLASLGGGVSARATALAVSGVALPAAIPDAQIQLQTTIHALHVSLGWRWVVADHFVVRASLGYLQSVGSSSSLALPSTLAALPGVATQVDQINQIVDTKMNDTYTKYLKMPVMGLSLGYRF